jgi:hypothetical protein
MGPGRRLVAVAAARHDLYDLYDAFIKHARGGSPFESGGSVWAENGPVPSDNL